MTTTIDKARTNVNSIIGNGNSGIWISLGELPPLTLQCAVNLSCWGPLYWSKVVFNGERSSRLNFNCEIVRGSTHVYLNQVDVMRR